MKLVTAAQMRDLDLAAIEKYGIPSIVLMENAGRGTVDAMVRLLGSLEDKVVSIFVGPGNNGGDGLVIARHIHQRGGRPEIFLLVEAKQLKGDAAVNFRIVQKLPIPVHLLLSVDDLTAAEVLFKKSDIIVDSIFGTGLAREVTGHFVETIRRINRFTCPVIAVDVPSGLCADTGRILGTCVQADLTATFGLAKPGQATGSGKDCVGELEVVDIGIPPEAWQNADIRFELLDEGVGRWLPRRLPSAHKGTYGHLLIVAGSSGKTGAGILCARGALRGGAGLVSLCVPHDLNPVFESAMSEAMTIPLLSSDGKISIKDYSEVEKALAGKNALAVGPGLGTDDETGELIIKLYRECPLPMVVDADGLNILARNPASIKNPPAPRILTPHPGEMSRLINTDTGKIQNNRLQLAETFAKENRVFVVLKGAGTVIAAPNRRVAINPTGNPGMATGGTGDVLTGFLGALLAQGFPSWEAACLGVYGHGLAGDRLAATDAGCFEMGYLASELADELPRALNALRLGFA